MQRPTLDGRSILIVEDEPLIVMDITKAFEATGATLTTTNTLRHALILAEHDGALRCHPGSRAGRRRLLTALRASEAAGHPLHDLQRVRQS